MGLIPRALQHGTQLMDPLSKKGTAHNLGATDPNILSVDSHGRHSHASHQRASEIQSAGFLKREMKVGVCAGPRKLPSGLGHTLGSPRQLPLGDGAAASHQDRTRTLTPLSPLLAFSGSPTAAVTVTLKGNKPLGGLPRTLTARSVWSQHTVRDASYRQGN